VKIELGNRPRDATTLIHLLNSKNKYQIQKLKIEDRTTTILEVKKVLTKRDLMLRGKEQGNAISHVQVHG